MSYMITDACTCCGLCETGCKNQAISEKDMIFVIDPDRCTECVGNFDKPRCVEVCLVEACVPDPEYEESREQLLEKWHSLHPGETPAY